MAQVHIVVGAQWGDEGKGKWIDYLSKSADMIARYQGGNNAGHTLVVEGKKYIFHHLPSGALHNHTTLVMLAGTVINPADLLEEIHQLPCGSELSSERLWLSSRAHVITPWHRYLDVEREEKRREHLGTTKKGIGPTYSDRTTRLGLTLGAFVDPLRRGCWWTSWCEHYRGAEDHRRQHPGEWQQFFDSAAKLQPYVCDAERRVREQLARGKQLICEGAQGTLLDLSHGTYPFVTSSHTVMGGALVSLGLGVQHPLRAVGIAKAYTTRVGEGPFPTEITGEIAEHLAEKGGERGATTGRLRRVGWLDGVALRYACEINGFSELYINKLDILAGLEHVHFCRAYQHPELGSIESVPDNPELFPSITAEYEVFDGWSTECIERAKKGKIDGALGHYLEAVSRYCGVPVSYVGLGAGRKDYGVFSGVSGR